MDVALVLEVGGRDLDVVFPRALRTAVRDLADDHPRVVVAEDAAVLLVAGRVGRDLAELQVVAAVGRVEDDDAPRRVEVLLHAVERPDRVALVGADARHRAEALRLDEDPAVLARLRADLVAEVVVGAQEPFAVPARLADGLLHLRGLALGQRGLVLAAGEARERGVVGRDVAEHLRDHHGLGVLPVLVRAALEGVVRVLREAVEVEAVVPVGAADERQAVRAEVVHGVVERAAQVLVGRCS